MTETPGRPKIGIWTGAGLSVFYAVAAFSLAIWVVVVASALRS